MSGGEGGSVTPPNNPLAPLLAFQASALEASMLHTIHLRNPNFIFLKICLCTYTVWKLASTLCIRLIGLTQRSRSTSRKGHYCERLPHG